MVSKAARPNLAGIADALRAELSSILAKKNDESWAAREGESAHEYALRSMHLLGAPNVTPELTLQAGEARTFEFTLHDVRPKQGDRPAVLAYALQQLCQHLAAERQRRLLMAERLAWADVLDAVRHAIQASTEAKEVREPLPQEQAGRTQVIARMADVREFLEVNFPEEERVDPKSAEESVRETEKRVLRQLRMTLSLAFPDLEIGELVDDGMGGDERARADRVRKERQRA